MLWLVVETLILSVFAVALGIALGVAAKLLLGRAPSAETVAAGPTLAEFLSDPSPADPAPSPLSAEPAAAASLPAELPVLSGAPDTVESEIQAVEAEARDSVTDPVRAAAADQVGIRPPVLSGPRDGKADDLKKIKGIGPQNEARLHGLGIYHLSQVAAWSEAEAKWVSTYLAFPGRIEREHWIEQARDLAEGSGR